MSGLISSIFGAKPAPPPLPPTPPPAAPRRGDAGVQRAAAEAAARRRRARGFRSTILSRDFGGDQNQQLQQTLGT